VHALLLTTLLSLPLYPINPVKQDTLDVMAMHFSVGVTAPNGLVKTGVDISTRYEFRVTHPVVLRTTLDYRLSRVSHVRYPTGTIFGPLFSLEALYYRGTNRMTGYVGGGVVLAMYDHATSQSESDSLRNYHGVTDVGLKPTNGYRLTFGLRFHRTTSFEVSITDVRPSFVYTSDAGNGSYSRRFSRARFNDFRISIGYVMPLWGGRHTVRGP